VQCPFDASTLQVVNRSGVEIDWCPSCKGVWLERGELDKLIDQVGQTITPPPVPSGAPARDIAPQYTEPRRRRRDDDDDDDDRRTYGDGYRRKKRKNPLAKIFDF
jgi:Zn-finger nucleic acid-binding protein